MEFNNHRSLQGCHAIFSASQYSWLRYTDEQAIEAYTNRKASELGTRIHAWAAEAISLGMKQPKSTKTICAYINDAIGYKMSPEVVLFYSERFFGTADAISFRREPKHENMVLRIHDLKTGKTPAKIDQLMISAALFCLEYRVKPGEIDIELAIYQNDEVLTHNPQADEILPIMDHIQHLDKLFQQYDNKGV